MSSEKFSIRSGTRALLSCILFASPSILAQPFSTDVIADFESPWAMTFLPDGDLLVTEMRGDLFLLHAEQMRSGREMSTDSLQQASQKVSGVPDVAFGGQGGLGDVILHPDFQNNRVIYLSYAEQGEQGLRGAAVARARLEVEQNRAQLRAQLHDVKVIWRQTPKVSGEGHYGHRLAFGLDNFLWITSGDRQKMQPAQSMDTNLGKIIRVDENGGPAEDNPFADDGEVAAQIWSLGHRNPLGLVFDSEGRLWVHEMGPKGGDELNRVQRGGNYGWPIVSNGIHYDDEPIPDHATRPEEFVAPAISWTPVISPAGSIIYDGDQFTEWQGNGFIGGLSSKALIRIVFEGNTAREAERFDMDERIREVEQGPDGAIWLLEDGRRDGQGRLLKLSAEK